MKYPRFVEPDGKEYVGLTRQIPFEDDNPLSSTRRIGTMGDFSLNNKSELNRNIPLAKFKNIDFSGAVLSPSKLKQLKREFRCSKLLESPESLSTVVCFLDFESLLKLMSIKKTFREGFTNNPSDYSLKINKIFKRQLR